MSHYLRLGEEILTHSMSNAHTHTHTDIHKCTWCRFSNSESGLASIYKSINLPIIHHRRHRYSIKINSNDVGIADDLYSFFFNFGELYLYSITVLMDKMR